jgi:hypothetical protein
MKPTEAKDPLEPMKDVEDVLRRALRHVDPPAGFVDRVVRRAAIGPARQAIVRGPMLRWATAAALAIVVGGGLWYRAEEHRRTEGEEARRQVLLTFRLPAKPLQLKINHQEVGVEVDHRRSGLKNVVGRPAVLQIGADPEARPKARETVNL